MIAQFLGKDACQGCHGTGKTGNLEVHFPDRENTMNLPKDTKKIFLHREFNYQHRENLEVKKKELLI